MRYRRYLCHLVILAIIPALAYGNERGGNKLYKNGKYAEAAQEYKDASIEKPSDARINFNRGNALYQLDSLQSAVQEYSRSSASENRPVSQRSFHNLGNALSNSGQYEQAIAAYVKSLQLEPGDKEAKYNLELALKKLLEQQQQQQNQQKQDEDQNQENKQQQEQKDQQSDQSDKSDANKQHEQSPQEQQEQQPRPADEGKMSKEDALRILNALQNDEKEVQKQLQRYVGGTRKVTKDW